MAGLLRVASGGFGLRLHQEYTYYGTRQELENKVIQLSSANVERLTGEVYKLTPDFSFGTMLVKGSPNAVDGINVRMSLVAISANEQKIVFTTKIRPEHYFSALLLAFFAFAFHDKQDNFDVENALWLAMLGAAMFLWFHLLFRFQEQRVVDRAAEELNLVELNK